MPPLTCSYRCIARFIIESYCNHYIHIHKEEREADAKSQCVWILDVLCIDLVGGREMVLYSFVHCRDIYDV